LEQDVWVILLNFFVFLLLQFGLQFFERVDFQGGLLGEVIFSFYNVFLLCASEFFTVFDQSHVQLPVFVDFVLKEVFFIFLLLPANAAALLASLTHARVYIDINLLAIQQGLVQKVDGGKCRVAGLLLDEAEAAGGFLLLVEAHDQILDTACGREQLQNLFL